MSKARRLAAISGATGRLAAPGQRRKALSEAASVTLIMLGLVAAAILGLWQSSQSSTRENFRHYLIGLAQSAATLVDPALHQQIRRPEQQNGPQYLRAVTPLRRMREAVPDIHYIYTMVRDGVDIRFVLDAADPNLKNSRGIPDQSGVWQTYRHDDPALLLALGKPGKAGIAVATAAPLSDEWGTFMTGYAPLWDSDGRQIGAIGVDVDATVYVARLRAARAGAILGLAPAATLILILGVVFYRIRCRGLVDATSAIESSEEARQTAEVLTLERRRLAEIIEGTDVGTWEWIIGSREISIHERCATMLGYHTAELQPFSLEAWRKLVHPDDLPVLLRTVFDCLRIPNTVFLNEFRMRHRAGHWLWILARGKVMARASTGEPTQTAGIAMDVSARKAMESALIEAAQRDKLTGLPNRTVFMQRLEHLLARLHAGEKLRFAILFLDFDHFKRINDTRGHEAGDELLRQIARRLQNAVRDGERGQPDTDGNLICRFGGDEFLILIGNLHDVRDAVSIAERLLNLLTPAYNVFGGEVHTTASIGIVTSEQRVTNAQEIVRNADVAMYEAKRSGRGCSVVFNETMHARLTRHVTIETSLRRAVGSAELFLEFQPIVELRTGRRSHVEALVRWRHPVLGMISPNEFIPIAEESGLIVAVGQWVLEESCRTMARWREADLERAPQMISVNVSRAEIALGHRLLQKVNTALEQSGLPARCLQLEVTERDVMRDPEAAREVLSELRRSGVKLAMDDFGTGTSSLSVLRGYPFDSIKIDRSFLKEMQNSHEVLALMHATVNLIGNLHMSSLAEGVEDATQVAILQSLGCHYAQGYFFSAPLPEARVLDSLSYAAPEAALTLETASPAQNA